MRKGYSNILISTISLLLIVGIVELMLKTFYPLYLTGYIGSYQYDKILGVRLKENLHVHKTTDYLQEIYTNQFGTVNLLDKFIDYETLVFAIGDSYTQGTGLPVDASYPFQLSMISNIKNDKYLPKYAVINLGLAAFGTDQAILSIPIYKKIYGKPNYILYLGCSNDYIDDIRFESGYRHRHLVEGSPHWGMFLRPLQWLSNETEIGKRLKLVVRILREKSHIKKELNSGIPVAKLQEEKLMKLLATSKEMNAKLIVSWTDAPQSLSRSYIWLKQWAKENGVAFADWHPKVESTLEAVPKLPITNQHSGGHYRTWVNNVIAASFYEHFQE